MLQQLLGLKELPKKSIQLMDWQQQFVIFLIQERWLEPKAILVGMHLLKQNEERVKNERNLYIISLCKQACHYCDFTFSTSMNKKEEMVLASIKKLLTQK
jgi:2-iminoacetate synthase ThiH